MIFTNSAIQTFVFNHNDNVNFKFCMAYWFHPIS